MNRTDETVASVKIELQEDLEAFTDAINRLIQEVRLHLYVAWLNEHPNGYERAAMAAENYEVTLVRVE